MSDGSTGGHPAGRLEGENRIFRVLGVENPGIWRIWDIWDIRDIWDIGKIPLQNKS